jgi:hypothetical protein
MRKLTWLLPAVALLLGCNGGDNDARTAWQKVLSQCATTDLVSPGNILYFGPSNVVGPGSVFRKASAGDYRIRWPIKSIVPPASDAVIVPGADQPCSGSTQSNSDISATLGFAGQSSPISANLQGDFKKANSVEVKAGHLAWDTVAEGPYQGYVDSLPPTSGAQKDLFTGQMLVLYRALRVSGYTVNLTFSSSDAASLQAKYTGAQLGGQLGGGFSAAWSSSGTLTLSSSGDFYIAGQLVKYARGGFAGRGPAVAPTYEPVDPSAKATVEATN